MKENPPDQPVSKKSKPASSAGRYLLYALGEIVLVVIGILIALQINNWNEGQKGLQIEQQRYQNLIADLKNDHININKMIRELISKQDLNYEFYEISQNGKTPDSLEKLSGINSAPELYLVTAKNQLTELESMKNLQIRKQINDYITFENTATDDVSRLENIIKSRIRTYFQKIDAMEIESVFVPKKYYNKGLRPSFSLAILSPHFKDTDFKSLLISLRMSTGNALNSLNALKDKNEALQIILKSKI